MRVARDDKALRQFKGFAPTKRPALLKELALRGTHPNHGARDGSQTFTNVHLTRAEDGSGIPYTSIHGITLITIMRLGLVQELKTAAYHQFMALPLYEDMAPWNIVFRGPKLDYIDYDTKDKTFDGGVKQIYKILSALFNYKRTVEDFKMCGEGSGNPSVL